MYRPRSKREQRIRFILTYTITPVLIAVVATIFVMMIQGYRFNPDDNKVFQAGLVQFQSRPTGAKVSVDGAELGSTTNTRINVRAGSRTIGMTRDGYIPWQKTVTVPAGGVLWLDYTRLIPEQIMTDTLYEYDNVASSLVNSRENLLGLLPSSSTPSWVTIRADNSRAERTSATLPSALYDSRRTSKFQATDWSESGRYVLLRDNAGSEVQWYVLDRQEPEESYALRGSGLSGIDGAEFDERDERNVYLYNGKVLYRYDSRAGSLSEPLARDVVKYQQSATGIMVFVSERNGTRTLGYITPSARTSKQITLAGAAKAEAAEIIRYDGDDYLSVIGDGLMTIWRADLPSSDSSDSAGFVTVATLTAPRGVASLNSPIDSRFIAAYGNRVLLVYNLEQSVVTQTRLETRTRPAWLDGAHVIDERAGQLVMQEFDGGNAAPITGVAPGAPAVLSSNGRYLYTLNETPSGIKVVRALLQP